MVQQPAMLSLPDALVIAGREVRVKMVSNRQIRHLSVSLQPFQSHEVVVKIPGNFAKLQQASTQRQLLTFLSSKRNWLVSRISKWPNAQRITQAGQLPCLGQQFQLRSQLVCRNRAADQKLIVDNEGKILYLPSDDSAASTLIKGWLSEQLIQLINSESADLLAAIGWNTRQIKFSLSTARGKWGSCTRSKHLTKRFTIRLNWRLAMAPYAIADYVLAHEIAHLQQMNHSRKFWQLLAQLRPQYKTANTWLRTNGLELFKWQLG